MAIREQKGNKKSELRPQKHKTTTTSEKHIQEGFFSKIIFFKEN
jgi:hypothetical protein